MSSLLLATKLHVPKVRVERVLRPRLFTRLQQGLDKKLILVSAPAGYGKTTLICEWLAACGQPSAWVSLDKGDNDPSRFGGYVLAALQGGFASVGKSLPDSLLQHNTPIGEALLTDLINELDRLQQPLILVLDDYHHIESQVIHEGLSFLLEHGPAEFHLVLLTRADPPLPLARLRARSEMLEIRQADLRFTAAEAADFLTRTMRLEISSEDIVRITARTEGWIAGLQMAALSMQNTEDVSGLITALSGSHHYIFDYLLEEVLERQPAEVRRFLLHTSVLGQLTAPLCDALFEPGADGSSAHPSALILDELEHANLFIIPLDHERRWYRYHSLFADLLLGYFQQKYADQIPILHTRASTWFEGQGLIADAIHHALMAGDWERVARLISTNVFALLEQNELNTVAGQLDSLTSEKSLVRPWLWVGRAWLAAYTGQLNSVASILDKAEADVSELSHKDDQRLLLGHCAAIRAYAAWSGGRDESAAQAARQALECLPETDLIIRCQSAILLGLSTNNMEARARAFREALDYARGIGVSHVVIFARGCQAYLLFLQGKLHEAHAACLEAIQLASSTSAHQPLPTLSHVYSTLSGILWEWNELDAALNYAREAVALARRWEQADALHFAYTNLGQSLFTAGDVTAAFDILHEAWQIARRTSPWFEEITLGQEVEWHLTQDDLEAALRCLSLAQIDLEEPSGSLVSSSVAIISGPIFLAQKQYARALTALAAIRDHLEERGHVYYSVRVYVWQAMAYHGLGQKDNALSSLEKALALSAPEGYLRSFFAAGGVSAALLRQARTAGILPDHVDRLLGILEGPGRALKPEPADGSRLIEPLSRRELDVLNLLAQGCSDKQIAESLVIARETVHKHLKNIYGKLDAHSRTQAVIRAREIGLL